MIKRRITDTMTKRDYYEVLNVSKTASKEEIKSSYRKLAMKYHPDKNPGNKDAEAKFKELAEAYEVLSDENKKSMYDRFGHQGVSGAGGFRDINDIFSSFGDIFGGFGGGSIFDDFFGGGQTRRRSESNRRGTDLRINLKLMLEEIAEGTQKEIKVKKFKRCPKCEGSGAKGYNAYESCRHCNGSGEIRHVSRSMFGQFINVTECSHCSGEGRIIKDKCDECFGEGLVKGESRIKVDIPSGVSEGQYIPMRGHGNAGKRGGNSGDLYLYIEEEKHKIFKRDGDDIYMDLEINIAEAVLGTETEIPTLKGEKLNLTIDAGTQSGTLLKVKGKGIKNLDGHGKGDQIVRVNVFIPSKVNHKEKELLKELSASENFRPKKKGGDKKAEKAHKGFFKNVFG